MQVKLNLSNAFLHRLSDNSKSRLIQTFCDRRPSFIRDQFRLFIRAADRNSPPNDLCDHFETCCFVASESFHYYRDSLSTHNSPKLG